MRSWVCPAKPQPGPKVTGVLNQPRISMRIRDASLKPLVEALWNGERSIAENSAQHADTRRLK
jgi:hypothetical protein